MNDGWRGMDFTSSAVFFGADQSCSGDLRGIGFHCFGDFGELFNLASMSNPWNGVTAQSTYPAATILLYKPFVWLADVFGYRVSLFAFLSTLFISCCVPMAYVFRRSNQAQWPTLFLLVGPLSIPFLMAYDRGQSVAWLVPIVIWFLRAAREGNMWGVVLAAVMASVVRPHFALLGLVFLIWKQWKPLVSFLVLTLTTQITSWFFWWESIADAPIKNLEAIVKYRDHANADLLYPPQITVWRGVQIFLRQVGIGPTEIPQTANEIGGLIGPAILVLFCVVLLVRGKKMRPLDVAIPIVVGVTLLPGTTYVYYLAVFMPIVAVLLLGERFDDSSNDGKEGLSVESIRAFAVGSVLLPIPIGQQLLPDTLPSVAISSQNLTGLVWVIVCFGIIFSTRTRQPA